MDYAAELLMDWFPFLSQGTVHALTGCALGGLAVGCLVMGLRDPDWIVDAAFEVDQPQEQRGGR